jgi:hypothetical protein
MKQTNKELLVLIENKIKELKESVKALNCNCIELSKEEKGTIKCLNKWIEFLQELKKEIK